MNELEQRMVEYLDAFETFAQQATPQAVDLALAIVFWESLGILIVSWLILLGGGYAAYRLLNHARQMELYRDGIELYVIGGIITAAGAFVSLIYVLNPWLYIGIVRPELKLARDVFTKVVGQ